MTLRPTQASTFNLVRLGLQSNMSKLARAQEQVASGKRILRPSDDALGTSIAMSLKRHLGRVDSFQAAIDTSRPIVSTATSELQEGSNLFTDARALILQSMNGTLSDDDRAVLANEIELLRESFLRVANTRSGDRYLFSGTETKTKPFESRQGVDGPEVVYHGNDAQQSILVGRDVELQINIAGSDIFGKFEYSDTSFAGLTGMGSGASADFGVGYAKVDVRHDLTTAALGAGLVLANGGADDTVMGDHALVVDALAGTVQLGSGIAVSIPSPLPADLVLHDADGSEFHLDMTGWTGVSFSGTVSGSGSVSIDGATYQAVTLTETNLELVHPDSGDVVHLDTTGITRAGEELVTFEGTANLFDTLAGVVADLRNEGGMTSGEVVGRLNERLGEFDRNHRNFLTALGQLGSRAARLDATASSLADTGVHLQSLVSSVEDADLAEVILDLTRAEQTLQVAQATGARLLQQTLLNYL